jgi:hypothetical protein
MALQACRRLIKAIEVSRETANIENNTKVAEPLTMAEEDKIMTHMMDCLALMAAVQSKMQQKDVSANSADARTSRNKVFMVALSILGESLLGIDKKNPQKRKQNVAIDQLLLAFPVPGEIYPVPNGRKGWLPLHWAVTLMSSDENNVTKADVKTSYELDPMAMQSYHFTANIDGDNDEGDNEGFVGLTPAHLLCMSPVTQCSMQLVRSFSVCNPMAFGKGSKFSALHAACRCGTPTVELLQHLLQLEKKQAKVRAALDDFNLDEADHYPLGQLCFNLMGRADELPNAEDLVNCLLEVDKSWKVVGDAVFGCIEGYDEAWAREKAVVDRTNCRLFGMVEMLLKANPKGAKYGVPDRIEWYERNILHIACSSTMPSELCIDIMRLVHGLYKNAVREGAEGDQLPAHYAAEYSDVEVVEFLLGLYPGAANALDSCGQNLLHLAVGDPGADRALPKVRYLCSWCPAMMQQRDEDGQMPVHIAISPERFETALAFYEAGGIEQFKTPIAHPTDATHYANGRLPLYVFIGKLSRYNSIATTSAAADMFRWLLRLYPEAAGIEGGVGADKKTPYQLAVDSKLPDYYLRLLLRAAPTLNPAELHRLNYAERRMAMFLAFKATMAGKQTPLLARLPKDLKQCVVSFL